MLHGGKKPNHSVNVIKVQVSMAQSISLTVNAEFSF